MAGTKSFSAIALLFCLAGCTVTNRLEVSGGGSLAGMPPGRSAVLKVTMRTPETPRSEPFVYGVMDTVHADAAFAEMLAVAARDDAGIEIIHPFDVEKRLRQEELMPTMQPDAEQLAAEAKALGCASYLTAEIASWRNRFVLFASSAQLRCRVSCVRVADGKLVWQADIDAEMRGRSDRELARLALARMFEWLNQPHPAPDPNAPPLERE